MAKQPNTIGINVEGTKPETVEAIKESILAILEAGHASNKTKQKALDVLSAGVQIHTTLHSCNVNLGK